MNRRGNYILKGFTIAEVLVTLALTSLSVTFSYATLGYVQKLFVNYKTQNRFIQHYTDLKNRMELEARRSQLIIEEAENKFLIRQDTNTARLTILENAVILERNGRQDTFNMAARNIRIDYELMKNPVWTNKLINHLQFETEFSKQKFNFSVRKQYDSSVKMKLDKET